MEEVNDDAWMVGIFHKPEGENPQHAFLLVEGFDRGQTILRRYDLFVDEHDSKKFNIHIKEKSAYPAVAPSVLAEILKGDEIKGKYWPVVRDDAIRLHRYVQEQKEAPERIYNLLGDSATLPQTAAATESLFGNKESFPETIGTPGHSCFTWARQALYALEIPEIRRDLPKRALDLVVAIPTLHLSDRGFSETECRLL